MNGEGAEGAWDAEGRLRPASIDVVIAFATTDGCGATLEYVAFPVGAL